jgi:hypothetical protein
MSIQAQPRKSILEIGITPGVRSYVRKTLENYNDPKAIELKLYTMHGDSPKNYVYHAAILAEFSEPGSILGQFAKFYQEKIRQDVYTPTRIVELTVSEMLPEIFLNKNVSKELIEDIDKQLLSTGESYMVYVNNILNPGKRRITRPEAAQILDFKDVDKFDNLQDICTNPIWETKIATTIICKDNGKFYCLDAADILRQGDGAVNPYTGNKISKRVIRNLQKRYGTEQIIAEYSTQELARYAETRKQLMKLLSELREKPYLTKIPLIYESIVPEEYRVQGDNSVLQLNVEIMLNDLNEILSEETSKYEGEIDIASEISESDSELSEPTKEQAKLQRKVKKATKKLIKELQKPRKNITKEEFTELIKKWKEEAKKERVTIDQSDIEIIRKNTPPSIPKIDLDELLKEVRAQMPSGESENDDDDDEEEFSPSLLRDNTATKEIYDEYMERLLTIKEILQEDSHKLPDRKGQIDSLMSQVESEINKLASCCVSEEGLKRMLINKRRNLEREIETLIVTPSAAAYPGASPKLKHLQRKLQVIEAELESY